ncbi:hypothetical protein J2M53_16690 [Arthrobacter sp. zg-ZUI100]|uniref:hypothetical protein n=1 Tax=Arthrobacter jiangjiafuii TaxID=2817475 RepID=UPI001AEE5398|nr:hypothetical protein [Arthrobacter jiangjiafuii]MBP3037878.1 hypothetical protein [Arthrobacter jiangjiafuii]
METGVAVPLKTRMLMMRSPMFSLMALRLTVMPPSGEGEADGLDEGGKDGEDDGGDESDGQGSGVGDGAGSDCVTVPGAGSEGSPCVHAAIARAKQPAISSPLNRLAGRRCFPVERVLRALT